MLVLASLTVLSLDYHGEASRGITHVRNGVADALDRAAQHAPVGFGVEVHEPRQHAEQQLAIAPESEVAAEDDEWGDLEIPAFLRRQAN